MAHSSPGVKRMLWLLPLMIGGGSLGAGYVLVRDRTGPSPPPDTGPQLGRWSESVLNLGEGKVGEVLTGTFTLRNLGTEPLDFQIRPSCNCAQLQPREGRIAPGEVEEILAGVRLRNEGLHERVRLTIQTNDPRTPQVEYLLEANCPAPFDASPSLVDFGSVVEGQSPTAILKVRGPQDAPLGADADLRASVSSSRVSVKPAKGEGGERRLEVRLLPTAPRGHLQAQVTLTLAGADAPLHIPVSAYVAGQVMVAPQTLRLPAHAGEARFLVWRSNEKPLGKLRHVDAPPEMAVNELSDRAAPRRRFRVRGVGPVSTEGPHLIRLRFEELSKEVVVSVFVDKPAGK